MIKQLDTWRTAQPDKPSQSEAVRRLVEAGLLIVGQRASSGNFQLIQVNIKSEIVQRLPDRQRNQLIGCMHAHNELAVLNRLLLFSLNDVSEGEPHDHAHGVQMWCVLQVLIGKLFETWNMLSERFLGSKPEDPAIAELSDAHKMERRRCKTAIEQRHVVHERIA